MAGELRADLRDPYFTCKKGEGIDYWGNSAFNDVVSIKAGKFKRCFSGKLFTEISPLSLYLASGD